MSLIFLFYSQAIFFISYTGRITESLRLPALKILHWRIICNFFIFFTFHLNYFGAVRLHWWFCRLKNAKKGEKLIADEQIISHRIFRAFRHTSSKTFCSSSWTHSACPLRFRFVNICLKYPGHLKLAYHPFKIQAHRIHKPEPRHLWGQIFQRYLFLLLRDTITGSLDSVSINNRIVFRSKHYGFSTISRAFFLAVKGAKSVIDCSLFLHQQKHSIWIAM